MRPQRPDFQRRDRQFEVIDRTCRARPVENRVHRAFHVDVIRDVVLDEEKVTVREVRDVRGGAGQQIIDADNRVAAVEQGFRKVRADEARGTSDDDTHG